MLFEITERHGLHLDQEPAYGGRTYLEKQDYILMRQKEKLSEQEQKLTEAQNMLDQKANDLLKAERELHNKNTEIDKADTALQEKAEKLRDLTIRTEDLESMVEEVSYTAYNKAVEVVPMTVQQKTRKADYDIIRRFRDHDIDHDPTLTAKGKSLLKRHTGKLMERFRGMTQQITNMLIKTLHDPQKKEIYKEPIRISVRDQLAKAQKESDARNAQCRSVTRSVKKRENVSEHEYL